MEMTNKMVMVKTMMVELMMIRKRTSVMVMVMEMMMSIAHFFLFVPLIAFPLALPPPLTLSFDHLILPLPTRLPHIPSPSLFSSFSSSLSSSACFSTTRTCFSPSSVGFRMSCRSSVTRSIRSLELEKLRWASDRDEEKWSCRKSAAFDAFKSWLNRSVSRHVHYDDGHDNDDCDKNDNNDDGGGGEDEEDV